MMPEITIQKIVSQNSVDISTDSKGSIKLEVKVYDDNPDTASARAQAVFDALFVKYSKQMP